MEKYSTCCCCRAKIGEAFGKGNVKIQLAVGLLFVFEFIKEIKSALAEGMSTCYLSPLMATDQGLLLKSTFPKLCSSPCWGPGWVPGQQ